MDQWGTNTWKAMMNRLEVGSANPRIGRSWGGHCLWCVFSRWLSGGSHDPSSVHGKIPWRFVSLVDPWIMWCPCVTLNRWRVLHLHQWRVFQLRSMWQPSPQLRWRGWLHRSWVSISFHAHCNYIQIISKYKWKYIILNKMHVINAYTSIYICENIDS
jgi:hypothetical protein